MQHGGGRRICFVFNCSDSCPSISRGKKTLKVAYGSTFTFEADEQGLIVDPQNPVCKTCRHRTPRKWGNTSNLAKHLKDRHPDLYKEFKVSAF